MKNIGGTSVNFRHVTEAQYSDVHRIIESQNGVGWKGPQESSNSYPPAMIPDTSHQTRLP